jgi:hypothetical protein
MRQQYGLKPDALSSLLCHSQTSRGWRLAPRSLLGEGLRWIFL